MIRKLVRLVIDRAARRCYPTGEIRHFSLSGALLGEREVGAWATRDRLLRRRDGGRCHPAAMRFTPSVAGPQVMTISAGTGVTCPTIWARETGSW